MNGGMSGGPTLRISKAWLLLWIIASPICVFFSTTGSAYQLPLNLVTPSFAHPFGYDAFGRDVLQITARAGLNSMGFAAGVVAVSIVAAIFLASLIVAAPPRLKFIFLRLLEFLLAFPSLIVALSWAAIRGPGWSTLWFSLLIGTLPMLVRLIYARAQEVLVQDYIEASVSLGGSKTWVLARHVAPELFSLSLLKAPNLFAQALMAEATLSFLGLGAPIGHDTWGSLLAQGKDYLIEAPHLAVGVGIPLIFTILSLQKISESLETARHLS
jgi:peptide/nickel transport system permease protein